MLEFKNITHCDRRIFERTFLNEIVLLFAYEKVDPSSLDEEFHSFLSQEGCRDITTGDKGCVYNYQDAVITVSSAGTLVSIPSKEYKDFETSGEIWCHVERLFKQICINPTAWAFTKGNRFVFNKPISSEQYDAAFQLILSHDLLACTKENHLCAISSNDATSLFVAKYGLEQISGKDSLSLKIFISSMSYNLDGLREQVFERNKDMFNCWMWCMSEKMISFMSK